MLIPKTVVLLFMAMIAAIALTINPALAHRFDVALVMPPSDDASAQGRQILEGFMLATAERDSHPGQDSDGHLGGLDVYVTVIDGTGDVAAEIGRLARIFHDANDCVLLGRSSVSNEANRDGF